MKQTVSGREDIHWFLGSKSIYDIEEIYLFHMLTWKERYWGCNSSLLKVFSTRLETIFLPGWTYSWNYSYPHKHPNLSVLLLPSNDWIKVFFSCDCMSLRLLTHKIGQFRNRMVIQRHCPWSAILTCHTLASNWCKDRVLLQKVRKATFKVMRISQYLMLILNVLLGRTKAGETRIRFPAFSVLLSFSLMFFLFSFFLHIFCLFSTNIWGK